MIIVRVTGEDTIAVEWPHRLSEETLETVWWILDGVDYIDHIQADNYTTRVRVAAHLAPTAEIATFIANALMDDDTLATCFETDEWDEFSVRVEY